MFDWLLVVYWYMAILYQQRTNDNLHATDNLKYVELYLENVNSSCLSTVLWKEIPR